MSRAFDRDDLRVGEKLHARAADGFHEVTFASIYEQDRTFYAPDKRFDLPFGERRGGALAKNRIILPPITAAVQMSAMERHVSRGVVGKERKSLL